MVILILSYKPGISLHVPLPMNVANARYHSLLGDNVFQFCSPFALVRQASNAWARRPAYQAQGGATAAVRSVHADDWQLYGPFQTGCPSIRTSSTSTSGSIEM